jgi:hypothetical protein
VAPASVPDRIPLPPPVAALAEDPRPAARFPVVDSLLVGLLLLLAFLLASFPARNADVWMHLATGRAVASGQFVFGVDPFAQNTEGVYWVNHAWLLDLAAYGVYSAFGGGGLIVTKALLTAALAAVLVFAGRTGRGLWGPTACAALAVLAVAPWLQLQPTIVSYLFLALTLFILERPYRRTAPTDRGASFFDYWPLVPLFALWVNCDAWFLLGPATVGLYVVGQALQQFAGTGANDPRAVRPGEAASLALALLVGLVACLLNPYGYHAFLALPSQLAASPAAQVLLRPDSGFEGLILSPFQTEHWRTGRGFNPAGAAYFVLVALSGMSFVVNGRGWRWRRALVWTGLFLISAVQVRAVPFFAAAAGPMLALNCQEYLGRVKAASEWALSAGPRWAVAGRVTSLLAGPLVVAGAWPGWLQPIPYEPRGWAAEPDPALARAVDRLRELRRDGVLTPDDRAFTTSVDAANQLAWLYPEEKGFFDSRLTPFPASAAEDFVAVRDALTGRGGEAAAKWREVLRRNKITHLIVNDGDRLQTTSLNAAKALEAHPDFVPLCLEGGTAVFGWRPARSPTEPDRFEGRRLNWDRLGLRPAANNKAPPGPSPDPSPPTWTDAFLRSRPSRSPDRDEAVLARSYFADVYLPRQAAETDRAWLVSLEAAALGKPLLGAPSDPLLAALDLQLIGADRSEERSNPKSFDALADVARANYVNPREDGPPALLLLAVRAGRRAVHERPDDPSAWLVLGQAYVDLLQHTRERAWAREGRLPLLRVLRHAQAAAALRRALDLNPDLAIAHGMLAELYLNLQPIPYLDLARDHFKEHIRCLRAAGSPRVNKAAYDKQLVELEAKLEKLDDEVAKQTDLFVVNTEGLPAAVRADRALAKGLAGRALSILMESELAQFGQAGTQMELDLLLNTGQLKFLRDGLELGKPAEKDQKAFLTAPVFNLYRLKLAAAAGDYGEADAALVDLLAPLAPPPFFRTKDGDALMLTLQQMASLSIADAVSVGEAYPDLITGIPAASHRWGMFMARLEVLTRQLQERADLATLRGVLALEAGDADAAEVAFRDALSTWGDAEHARTGAGFEFSARPVAQVWLERLRAADR